jgi:hypothetical protein
MDGLPGILTPFDIKSKFDKPKGSNAASLDEEGSEEEEEGSDENQDPDDPKEPGRKWKPAKPSNFYLALDIFG